MPYTVAKVVMPRGVIYEAWHFQARLGDWPDPNQARDACETHYRESKTPSPQVGQ
jgi:hypothetical protein